MWPTFYIPAWLGAKAPLTPVEIVGIGCNNWRIYYTPETDTPSARAGDLVVLVVHGDRQSANNGFCTVTPDTWSTYLWCSMNSYVKTYGGCATAVLYKVLTTSDLSTDFTIDHVAGNSANNELCCRAYVLRNFHPDIPLDCFSFNVSTTSAGFERLAGPLSTPFSNAIGDYQFTMHEYRRDNSPAENDPFPSALVELTPPLFDTWHSMLLNQGVGEGYGVKVGFRECSAPLENLIAGEDWSSPLTSWSPTNLDVSARGTSAYGSRTKHAFLRANNVSGKHYVEVDVELAAGEQYSYHVGLRRTTSQRDSTGIAVIAPSGEEIGAVSYQNNGTNGSPIVESSSPYTDTPSGRETWWWAACPNLFPAGTPNTYCQPVSLFFEAQETGTHTLRIYVGSNGSASGLTHADDTEETAVYWAGLYAQFCSPTWVPSTNTGAISRVQPGPVYYLSGSSEVYSETAGMGVTSFIVNKDVPTLAPAVLVPYVGFHSRPKVSFDGLSATGPTVPGNGLRGPTICSRQVYPTAAGAAAAYYAEIEITSLSGTDAAHRIAVGPLHGQFWDNANNGGEGVYAWAQTGEFYKDSASTEVATSAWAATAGDKIGVMVDFANSVVKYYKNGTEVHSQAMTSTSAQPHDEMPWLLIVYGNETESTYFNYTANFTGPFGGRKPSGALAWDWTNEVA